ncbi:heavy-metal-associated domain-containing protein [Haladaptatus pallidirubidus]|uniref:Heavy-metal-associated domain-containing protein n=1 Tax=Haladaptatus pallidirubidus TaxID=1008152 RepID=A0AAV3UNQ3_9EURY|nr:cation transporter [Haladaptatus pallidirubidus]
MTTTIQVNGMNCGHCEQSVVEALEDLSGVSDASADHEAGTATVEGDTDTDELVATVKDAGYDAST